MTSTSQAGGARLRAALEPLLDGLPARDAASAVERLMTSYRGRTPTHTPVLRDRADAVAYAAYRMPATFAAVADAFGRLAARRPGWAPADHVDVGAGTGAAAWAAADAWSAPAGRRTLLLDWAGPAIELGRELAARSAEPALRAAEWRRQAVDPACELPAADLVSACYVLGELDEPARAAVADAAARAARPGGAVVLVEPGSPDGYLRIRAARDRLIAAGLRVLAPCPHGGVCPIEVGADWCHFASRVERSSLHRRVKGGSLPYEDEKFSYVAAVRPEASAPEAPASEASASDASEAPGERPEARVVRRPLPRKGQVLLDLCTADGELRRETVSRRQGPAYRAARNAGWGDAWPAPGPPQSPPESPPEAP
ncbi:small ribosomal subunit Rsm22 family protein [Streptomyces sp. B6B3]|uniref:small ribosomal subunit Rsm22 family protein n=1 Tax=Streptomyces sp. B6B3 TaxID=3153570 RepID=UPI00325F5921